MQQSSVQERPHQLKHNGDGEYRQIKSISQDWIYFSHPDYSKSVRFDYKSGWIIVFWLLYWTPVIPGSKMCCLNPLPTVKQLLSTIRHNIGYSFTEDSSSMKFHTRLWLMAEVQGSGKKEETIIKITRYWKVDRVKIIFSLRNGFSWAILNLVSQAPKPMPCDKCFWWQFV